MEIIQELLHFSSVPSLSVDAHILQHEKFTHSCKLRMKPGLENTQYDINNHLYNITRNTFTGRPIEYYNFKAVLMFKPEVTIFRKGCRLGEMFGD